jgi:hypothetical protein
MAYKTSLSNSVGFFNSEKDTNPLSKGVTYGRVVDVILDDSHKDYETFGRLEAINGIKYQLINEKENNTNQDNTFAYSSETNFKRVPLIGEIVEIFSATQNSANNLTYLNRTYYRYPLNLWNVAHHNALPDITSNITEVDFGDDVVEKENIGTLQPFPGDVYIEGRTGQSLRFSNFKHPKNIYTDDSNNGDPLAILRIGQTQNVDIFSNYVEDVNLDPSSIYLTSNHTIPLNPSTSTQVSYIKNDTPTNISTYKGNQIILNSGRIVLHSNQDHLLLNSKNSINLSSNSTNIDNLEYTAIESPEILLGAKATEPVLKGQSSVDLLNSLLDVLLNILSAHNLAATPNLASTQLIAAASEATPRLLEMKSELETLKSNKVFTE